MSFCNVTHRCGRYGADDYRAGYSEDGEEITIRITGNGFLYNMVRIILGTLIRVGRGFYEPEQVREILEAKNRKAAGVTAPPQGLMLMQIDYGEEREEFGEIY